MTATDSKTPQPQGTDDKGTDDKGTDDKTVVREYFNATGFERWRRIYGTTDDVNKVQKNIRIGHQKTVDNVLDWLQAEGDLANQTICDAGCGVGSLTIPLLSLGATVYASDIAQSMVGEAQARTLAALGSLDRVTFEAKDLEQITGQYDTVVCLDVLIHYPDSDSERMIQHLASLARQRLLVSFAPKTPFLTVLKRIGEFFPGPSKTTRAYQHREADIVRALEACGFKITRRSLNKAPFYFSRLIEAVRPAGS